MRERERDKEKERVSFYRMHRPDSLFFSSLPQYTRIRKRRFANSTLTEMPVLAGVFFFFFLAVRFTSGEFPFCFLLVVFFCLIASLLVALFKLYSFVVSPRPFCHSPVYCRASPQRSVTSLTCSTFFPSFFFL